MDSPLTVRMMINTTTGFGRGLARGISRYIQHHEHWTVLFEPSLFGVPRYKPALQKADGVIARIVEERMIETLVATGLPVINVSEAFPDAPFPRVIPDHDAIGRAAAEHLCACGFRRFAYCGFEGQSYSEHRRQAFEQAAAERSIPCDVFESKPNSGEALRDELEEIAGWLASFNEPTGVFTCNDWRGHHVLLGCALAQIAVPQQIGVIGVDNDDVVCDIAPTPLSSIDPNAVELGYQAAQLLHRWMTSGEEPPREVKWHDVETKKRRSTDVLLVNDPIVEKALALMQAERRLPATIDEVMHKLPLSRRAFERRFMEAVGMTPHAALTRARLERAAELLRSSDLSVQQIAVRCGFSRSHHLAAAFRKGRSMTPTDYRNRCSRLGKE